MFEKLGIFAGVTFKKSALFGASRFCSSADFEQVSFLEDANFIKAEFLEKCSFQFARFVGAVKFIGAIFGNANVNQQSVLDLTDATFEQPVSFWDAIFTDHYPILDGSVLPKKVTLTAMILNWPSADLLLLQSVIDEEDIRPTKEVAKESCSMLRHAIGKKGLHEDEHFFFRLEMGFAGQTGKWWDWLPYRAFGWVSDYGYSIWRPVIALVGLWTLGMLIYLIAFAARDIDAGLLRIDPNAAALSFANMFKFLGFQRTYFDVAELRNMSAGLQVWGGLQTILGFVLLFFLGLGLRTRFRLR